MAILAGLGGCSFGERDVPQGLDRPVVHAVLNPNAFEQSILVERTLTGRVSVSTDSVEDAVDPIVTGGGVPITDARVTVIAPDGSTAAAVQTRVVRGGSPIPDGTGVYQVLNQLQRPPIGSLPPGFGLGSLLRVVPGARYRLRVELADGRIATGESVIPGTAATSTTDDFSALTFNRDRDTVRLRWPAVPGARSYALRVASPYGAFFFFSDSASYALTGDLRNLFVDQLPRVFQPGFTQYVYIAAVDSNYFDYYRSTNSPFTGSGIINRLDGAIGLFGGYTPIMTRALFVRADDRDPIDGRFTAASLSGTETLRIWVDSRGNGLTALTGAYRLPGGEQFGVLGTLEGEHARLRAVFRNDARYIFRTMDGTLRGDTLQVTLGGQLPGDDSRQRTFVRTAPAPP
jgi:hypothetical protein